MESVSRLIAQFVPEHYDLAVTLHQERREFTGTVTIHGVSAAEANGLSIHAKDLTLQTVTIDGHAASLQAGNNDEFHLTTPSFAPGKHIVVIGFDGRITDGMHGMYPCYFEHDGQKKELIATQFESHHAREAFPCIDEPEAKATFDLTLTTSLGVTTLGNMPITSQHEEDGMLVTRFERTPRMSSYLLAWVVGELHKKSATTSDGVEVNVWATPAQSPESLDFALGHAVKTIEFFDEYFGVKYPLPKSDHVALPDFSSGAMENWGLITYREIALLADPKTTGIHSRQYIAEVVAHELSHQWFGNLVTMKWWNNLWLNESFATLMAYIAVDKLYPEWNTWLSFASYETVMALRRDSIDGVQAVQVDVSHPDEISSLFDGAIVYAKGARLLRMLEHYIGSDAFRRGLQTYFQTYAYQNTEADDLWDALATASGKPIRELMNTWISQPGYPVVHVSEKGLQQEQFFVGPHEPSQKNWPIPLNASSPEDVPALLETAALPIELTPGERLNVGDTAHFITHYEATYFDAILDDLAADKLTPIDRLQLIDESVMLVRAGILPSTKLLQLLQAYRQESSEPVWDSMTLAISELKRFVETDKTAEEKLRSFVAALARPQFERLGWDEKPGEPESDTKLRAVIIGLLLYGEDQTVIDHLTSLYETSQLADIAAEIRSLAITAVVRYRNSPEVFKQLLDLYRTTSSTDLKEDITSGLTSTRDEAQITTLLTVLTDTTTVRHQDVFRWFAYLVRARDSRQAAWGWVRREWPWIKQTFGSDKSYDDFPRYSASGLATREQLAEYRAFFEPLQREPTLTRVITLGIAEITGRLELLERDGAAVREALAAL